MASLILGVQPGFTDLADSTFDNGNAATAATMKSASANAKFAAVRTEEFWGYYRNGETVQLPVSPADGYQYSRSELRYVWSWWYTGAALAALNGTQSTPGKGAGTGAGTLLGFSASVDQTTGLVSTTVSYFKNSQTDTNDGILMVTTIAKRSR